MKEITKEMRAILKEDIIIFVVHREDFEYVDGKYLINLGK